MKLEPAINKYIWWKSLLGKTESKVEKPQNPSEERERVEKQITLQKYLIREMRWHFISETENRQIYKRKGPWDGQKVLFTIKKLLEKGQSTQ